MSKEKVLFYFQMIIFYSLWSVESVRSWLLNLLFQFIFELEDYSNEIPSKQLFIRTTWHKDENFLFRVKFTFFKDV